MQTSNSLTIDVEDWFHILDSAATPAFEEWSGLESRIEGNLERILELLHTHKARATFFWLGWAAERNKDLLRRCVQAGHEVASHGFAHLLAYKVPRKVFREDIARAKKTIEDATGQGIRGFRAAGFGIIDHDSWAFEVIREVGYEYDSSIFPQTRGHGGIRGAKLAPHVIQTKSGPLVEIPMSAVEVMGRRLCLFGGGYLRLSPKWLIRWGMHRLAVVGQPAVIYLHPRDIDAHHPRLALGLKRRFKCYVNLSSTMPKLEWLCREYTFVPMRELVQNTRLALATLHVQGMHEEA